jgi:hypothetical protein
VVPRPTTRTDLGGLVTIRSNAWNASALASRNPTSTRPKMAAQPRRAWYLDSLIVCWSGPVIIEIGRIKPRARSSQLYDVRVWKSKMINSLVRSERSDRGTL